MKPSKFNGQDRTIVATFGAVLAVCISLVVVIRTGILDSQQLQLRDRLLPATAVSTPASLPIRIGAYIENIYAFSVDDKTFDADGWVWISWPPEADPVLKTQNLAPQKWVNFVNQIQDWDFTLEPTEEQPAHLKDGQLYQNFKFSGHFYANELSFRLFPFQTIHLPLVFELADIKPAPDTPALRLVPDETASNVGAYIDVMGYKTMAFRIMSRTHEYATDFGRREGDRTVQTSQVAFVVSYQQSVNAALLTLFLPLSVVMALVLLSPMLSAGLWDIRLGIPPMGLLTLIFLQQGYKEKLPALPYITYMDSIYNTCYFVNLILFGLFLWGSNRLHQASEQEKSAVIGEIDRIDRRFQLGLMTAMVVLGAVNWIILTIRHG